MVTRPESIPQARDDMDAALAELNGRGVYTPCHQKAALYADKRNTPEDAAEMCGRGTDHECPVLALCEKLGFTESVYADEMVYGGLVFRRGIPVSETSKPRKPKKGTYR